MSWSQLDTGSDAGNNWGSGHVFTAPAGAPAAGDLDVLVVNSDTTVQTPAGYTLPVGGSQVGNQGAYVFYRIALGTEPATTTITTNGNFPVCLSYQRWRGAQAFDKITGVINTANQTSAQTAATGALATINELAITAVCLHGVGAWSNPTYPAGYAPGPTATFTGSVNVLSWSAAKTTAGTASEAPLWQWTIVANDITSFVIAFTPSTSSGGVTVPGRPGGLRLGGKAGTLSLSAGVGDGLFLGPMANLLTCLGQEVARTSRGAVKHLRITPGEMVIAALTPTANECCDGIASVRLVRFHPTDAFPSESMRAATMGGVTSWAVEVEMHVIRCSKQPGPNQAPSDAALTSDASDLMADWAAMRRAACCLYDAGLVLDYVIGNGQPTAAEGGCMGSTLNVTLQVECAECGDGIN